MMERTHGETATNTETAAIRHLLPVRNGLPPEIIRLVLEHLEYDWDSLRSAILVNSTWAAEGISVLWQYPPVRALASIESACRRQFYANQIHALNFDYRSGGMQCAKFCFLEFPRLKKLDFDFRDYEERLSFSKSLQVSLSFWPQPSLETFASLGGPFDSLESRCPMLQKIDILSLPKDIGYDHLLKFYESCKFLKSIQLYLGKIEFVDERLLAHFASREGLVDLRMGEHVTYDIMKSALENVQDPFKNIQELYITLESKAVVPLIAAIVSSPVNHLRLEVLDPETTFLPMIGSG